MSDVSDKKISVFMDGILVGTVKLLTDVGMSLSVNRPVRMGSTHTFGLSLPGSLKIVNVNAIVISASPKGMDVGFLEIDQHSHAGIMLMLDRTATEPAPEAAAPPPTPPQARPAPTPKPAAAPAPLPKPAPKPAPAPPVEPRMVIDHGPPSVDLEPVIEHGFGHEIEAEPDIVQEQDFELVPSNDYSSDIYMRPARKKILIVEDTPQILNLYKSRLLLDDYEVDGVESAELAIAYLRDNGVPDLMLLDLVLPGMDGYKLLTYIRSAPDLKYLKVIILSAKGASPEIDKAMALGISGYLIKTSTSPEKLSGELKAFFAFN